MAAGEIGVVGGVRRAIHLDRAGGGAAQAVVGIGDLGVIPFLGSEAEADDRGLVFDIVGETNG